MSNYWLDKKKEEELANIAPATRTIPLWNFEEAIKAVLDKHTLTYFAGASDYIISGPPATEEPIYVSGPPATEEPIYVNVDPNLNLMKDAMVIYHLTRSSDNWELDL